MLLDPMLPTPIRMQLPLTTIRRHLTDTLANRIASIPANGLGGREGIFSGHPLLGYNRSLPSYYLDSGIRRRLRCQLLKLTGHSSLITNLISLRI